MSLPAVQYDEMIALDVKMLPHHQMYTLVFLNNDVSLDLQPSFMPFHFPQTIDIMLDISSIINLYIFQQLGHIMPYYHKGFSSTFLISFNGSYISTPSLFSPTSSTCISLHSVPLLQCSNNSSFFLWNIAELEAGGTKMSYSPSFPLTNLRII